MSAMVSQINGVSIVYSNVCSGADQRKHQSSSASMALWGEFTVDQWKGPVTRKMFPFDDVITMLKLWGNTLWCISLSIYIHICMCVCICAYSESKINARKNTPKTPDMKCLVSLAQKVQQFSMETKVLDILCLKNFDSFSRVENECCRLYTVHISKDNFTNKKG